MTLIPGATLAIAVTTTHAPRTICPPTWSDTRTSTTTATGALHRSTVMSGTPEFPPVGLLTMTDTGPGWIRGDGRGSTTRAGVMHPSTTAAGFLLKAGGAGSPDHAKFARFTLPLLLPSLAEAASE